MCPCYVIHETKKYKMHHQVYMFDELIDCNNINLRSFSAINYIKNDLWNKVLDQWMNNCLMIYIEKKNTKRVSNDIILRWCQKMEHLRVIWMINNLI
jgi:hypothetical protein